MKLAVLTCIHGNLKRARAIANKFESEAPDAVVLAGDLSALADIKAKTKSLKALIEIFLSIKKPIYIIPGSHETVECYKPALAHYKKNKLVHDCSRERKVRLSGYNLVFLPGSDSNVNIRGSRYMARRDLREIKLIRRNWRRIALRNPAFFSVRDKPVMYGMSELSKLANRKSILISHIPPKFIKLSGIDVAEFGESVRTYAIRNEHARLKEFRAIGFRKGDIIHGQKGVIYPTAEAKLLVRYRYPMILHKKNVGNEYLKRKIRQIGITKVICGHIHESGGKACDLAGNRVPQNKWSGQLCYNASDSPAIYEIIGGKARVRKL